MAIAEELITEERSGMSARRGLDERNKGTAGRISVTGSLAEATGRAASLLIPRIRTELLTGIVFLLMAGLVAAGVADF